MLFSHNETKKTHHNHSVKDIQRLRTLKIENFLNITFKIKFYFCRLCFSCFLISLSGVDTAFTRD